MLLALVVGDRQLDGLVRLLDRDLAVDLGDLREALRLARLEELDDTRQTLSDVQPGNTAGVEGPHGELGARLADRLRGDDADRVPDLDEEAGRRHDAVALAANPGLGLALEHRADRDGRVVVVLEALGDVVDLGPVDLLVPLQQVTAALGRELLGGHATDQVRVELAAVAVERHLDVVLGLAVVDADDHVLGDVDQAPGQVARVRGAQRGVGEALPGAVRRDEVLEHREALHEVGLDRPLDDLALRIGHQASHAGQLANLLERAAGSRVGHHEDRVQLVEVALHRLPDLLGRAVPA